MPQEVLCPICGAAYHLAEEQLGKRVRCKKCEHPFTAGGEPRPRRADDDEDAVIQDRPRRRGRTRRDRDDEDERPKKTRPLEEQARPRGERAPGVPVSSFVILGVIVGVVLLCCGGGALFYALLPQNRAPRPNIPGRRGELHAPLFSRDPGSAWRACPPAGRG
jgi:predicted Zn finger-like uncharacterized protein